MACTTINIKDPHLQQLINKLGQKEGMIKYLKSIEFAYKNFNIPREFKESYDKLYKEYKQYADKAISYPTENQAKLNAENLEKIFGKGNVSIVNKGDRNTSWLVVPIAPKLESEKEFEIRWNKELSPEDRFSNEILENNLQYIEQLPDIDYNNKGEVLAPNGNVSKLYKDIEKLEGVTSKQQTLQLYKQTRSKEFKEWFGDSKVVDENGEPLIVYHNSNAKFNTFNSNRKHNNIGIYFTPNKEYKEEFKQFGGNTGIEYAVFLRITNPDYNYNKSSEYINKDEYKEILSDNKDGVIGHSINKYKIIDSIDISYDNQIDYKEEQVLLNKGYIKTDVDESGSYSLVLQEEIKQNRLNSASEIIVFEPNQIKSVFNQSTFSKEDDNIYYVEQLSNIPIDYQTPEYIAKIKLDLMKQLKRIQSLSNKTKGGVIETRLETILKQLDNVNDAAGIAYLKHYAIEMIGGKEIQKDGNTKEIEGALYSKLQKYQLEQQEVSSRGTNTEEWDKFMAKYANFLLTTRSIINGFKEMREIGTQSLQAMENPLKVQIVGLRDALGARLDEMNVNIGLAQAKFFRDRFKDLSTDPKVLQGILDIFEAEQDENVYQANLDSLADSHNTFISLVAKHYEINKNRSRKEEITFQDWWQEFKSKAPHKLEYYQEKNEKGQVTSKLITEFNSDYRREQTKLKNNIELAKAKYGELSDEHLRAIKDKSDWNKKNLRRQYNKVVDEYNSIFDPLPKDSPTIKAKKWEAWKAVYKIDQELNEFLKDSDYTDTTGEFDIARMSDEDIDRYDALVNKKSEIRRLFSKLHNAEEDYNDIFVRERQLHAYAEAKKRAEAHAEDLRKISKETGDNYMRKWLLRNTKVEFSQEFWGKYKDVHEKMESLGMGKRYKIHWENIRNILSKYKVEGKVDVDKISDDDKKEVYNIQKLIYQGMWERKKKFEGKKTPDGVQEVLDEMKELYQFINTDKFDEIKAQKRASLSDEEWFNENHFENPYSEGENDRFVPVAYYTEIMPKNEEYIDKEAMSNKWYKSKIKDEYQNTKESIERAKELLKNAIKSKNNKEILRLEKIIQKYDEDNLYRETKDGYVLPQKQWKNEEYVKKNLDKDEWYQEFNSKLAELTENSRGNIIKEGYLPALRKDSGQDLTLKQRLGVTWDKMSKMYKDGKNKLFTKDTQDIVKEISVDENGKVVDSIPFRYLNKLEQEEYLHPTGKETVEELEEMFKENDRRYESNKQKHEELSEFDMDKTMQAFISTAINFKFKKELESELLLAREVIKEVDILPGKGTLLDKTAKQLGYNKKVVSKGSESNIYKHYNNWLKMVFYEDFEADEGLLQDVTTLLQNYTSLKAIGFNVFTGINNVAMGKVQMLLESFADTFIDRESYKLGKQMYSGSGYSNILEYIQERDKQTSKGLSDGLIKYFDIMESQDELRGKMGGSLITKIHKELWIKNAAYAMQHIGEHLMQNQMLLSMMHFNRVINGKIYNEREYIERMSIKYPDKTREQLKAEFKDAVKLADIYELDNGKIKLKDGYKLDRNEEENFRRKVIAVNQGIHGIYNKDHAGAMQHYALGRVAIQFRKHMRPMFTKRFGRKFWQSGYNEHREIMEEGMYKSTTEFIIQALSDYKHFYKNAVKQWGELSEVQKSNIKRTAVEMGVLASTFLIYMLVNGLRKGIPPEDKLARGVVSRILLQLDRVTTETNAYTPTGMIRDTKAILSSPAAGVRTVGDITEFVYQTLTYPFRPNDRNMNLGTFTLDAKEYTVGRYKGDSRIGVALWKLIPPLKVIQDAETSEFQTRYWKLF